MKTQHAEKKPQFMVSIALIRQSENVQNNVKFD